MTQAETKVKGTYREMDRSIFRQLCEKEGGVPAWLLPYAKALGKA